MRDLVDALIIGGGPAGIAAAIWCADLGFSAILFEESDRLGGQLNWTHNTISNFPGVDELSPDKLTSTLTRQLNVTGTRVVRGSKIVKVDLAERSVLTLDGTRHAGRGLLIATGVRRRKLNVPGEITFQGKGILASGALERTNVKGQNVVIIGGGDAALENANILGEYAATVTVVHRGEVFSARPDFVAEAGARTNVEFLLETKILEFSGDETLRSVTVTTRSEEGVRTIPADFVLVRIGVEPNTALFADEINLSADGYIEVNSRCQTSVPLVFAIGDVAKTDSPTVPSAIGMAATAVKNLQRLLTWTRSDPNC